MFRLHFGEVGSSRRAACAATYINLSLWSPFEAFSDVNTVQAKEIYQDDTWVV